MINYQSYIDQTTFENDMPNPKISRVRMTLLKKINPIKTIAPRNGILRENNKKIESFTLIMMKEQYS